MEDKTKRDDLPRTGETETSEAMNELDDWAKREKGYNSYAEWYLDLMD